ncbi:hypothetical protein LOTGIDRAFT_235026 [Lottia gigantea]|uniref:Uncharacterized protein n=1 Tax=Lottia gigantea TaxID=225164 RepID=V3ZT53_LOTGI|nr:hypothetical protein LOTGIDRAFT_235026 [Lottia gigantea]ESO87537.1 hypothetical protein LOTGIDRAFT_235026 [Lottia gigantea]
MGEREIKNQTVFLIDLETLNLTNAAERKQVHQSIILSTFRILYFFQCQSHKFNTEDTGKKGDTLKWSFKFFHSSTYKAVRNQSTLREFRLKHFSEFENECEKILSKQQMKSQSPKENPQSKTSKTSSPADNLSKALKEVIYDFQWESPEFFSPMKGRKNHLKKAVPTSSNSVFVFSKIPKDAQDLRSFCGKKVIDDEVFMDSFMSSSLFDMFHILSKLSLFWIDTELHQTFKDKNAQEIVSKSLKKVGGCFISLNSLVKIPLSNFKSCVHKPLSDISTEKHSLQPEEQKNDRNFGCIFNDFINNLPIETVLHHKIDTNTDNDCEVEACFNLVDGCIAHTNPDYQHLPIAQSYLCHNVKDYSAAGTLPNILPDMLSDLMKEDKKMVVLSTGVLPYLGILHPVTENGCMLLLYHIGSTLQIEKAMLKQEYKDIEENDSKTDPIPCKLSSNQLSGLGQQFHLHSRQSNHKQKGIGKRKVKKYKPQVLDKWHLPGTSHGMESIVMKLNERLNDLEFLDSKEKNTLKKLQKFYRKQNQPPKLEDLNPTAQFQHIDENALSAEDIKLNNTTTEAGYSLRRQSSSLSRTDIIMNRSKHVQKRQSSEIAGTGVKTSEDIKCTIDLSNIDLQTDEDVCNYIKDLYQNCLDTINSNNLETTIRTLVTVVLHYMKTNNRSEPEESCKSLINKTIKQSNSQLREKYQTRTTDQDKKDKMSDYKLQILLLLELESVIMSEDEEYIEQCAEEAVNMLRTVSFIYDQSVVPTFLNEVIVTNYSATLPKLLISIFDELMQPLPPELAGFASPNTSADTPLNHSVNSHHDNSVFQEPSSNTSNHSDILLTQPSRRSRRVVHHPSLSNIGSKKQIMVALDNKPKVPKEKKEKRRTVVSKPSKSKPKQGEAVKVRRNLFEGEKPKIDRRQSVAIMESVRRSPRKHKISSTIKNSFGSRSPHKRLVSETPSHKQKSNVVWRQQERKRRRTNSKDDINVVEESPIKACEDQGESVTEVKASPGRFRKKATVTRRSFYSASSTRTRPRNLSAYYNLGDRIAGRNRGLSQTEDKLSLSLNQLAKTSPCKKFMSPTRRSRDLLMSQLMSPSPNKNITSRLAQSPSQRTRSKTPSRILFESPRRRVHSPSKLLGVSIPESPHGKTPKKQTYHPLRSTTTPKSKSLVCETPEKTTPTKVFNTPLKHTPKRSSELNNKENRDINHENIHHTPISSRKIPSTPDGSRETSDAKAIDHTLKLNSTVLHETPTKTPKSKSVKKALLKDSPFRNTRSQGPITPTRNSVCTALFTTSPLKTYVPPQARPQKEESAVFKTPSKTFKLKSPPSTHKQKLFSPLKNVLERNSKVENISPDKPTYIIRTPSPHDKNIKTPDSLDKWPRVKRHRESPARKVKINKPSLADVIDDNSVCDPILESKMKKKRHLSDCDSSETYLLSPKRQRLDNETHTQTNELSSKGYFSNINNSVFLPIKQPDDSGENNGDFARKESPVFGSSPLRTKMESGTLGITNLLPNSSQESTLSDVPVPFQSKPDSPVFKGKSPVSKIQLALDTTKGKKFSPSLSSKSLVQLMNSPLLQSGKREHVTSPRKKGLKSRKSLKLGD